jgi:serine/threonine protein kinase
MSAERYRSTPTTFNGLATAQRGSFANNVEGSLHALLLSSQGSSQTSVVIPPSQLAGSQLKDYQIGKELGKGAYAVVKHATHRKSSTSIAMKIYDKYKLTDPARKNSVKREISLLSRLNH